VILRLAALFAAALPVFCQGPENVLLVVNKSSPESLAIGKYYAERRTISSGNICFIKTPPEEKISRQVYDFDVEKPVAKCLKSRKLVEQVTYIVTTLGVPLGINGTSGRDATMAAVDSELAALYPDLHGKNHDLPGPLPNPFLGRRDEPFRHPRFPMYLVCRLAAYDVDEVKQMIDHSLEAENRGRVVIDMKSAEDSKGNDWLRNAAILVPRDRLVFDESETVLYGQTDVIAYASWGSNDPNRKKRFLGFHWLPGAIMTEYVSSNGRTFKRPPDTWNITTWSDRASSFWAGSPQSLTADYIHEGATGASGHVYEPFLNGTPRPDYLIPAYLSGRNLAESYYLSIPALSWQNIVVGDPLCRLKPVPR